MKDKLKHVDRNIHPPEIVGAHGAAWRVDLARSRAAAGCDEDRDTTVAMWIVFAPWAHAFWSYYLIAAIHLRSMPKLVPAKINLPGATHEVIVFALSPDHVPEVVNSAKNVKLFPANFAGQWVVQERRNPVDLDRAAAEKIEGVVREIVEGRLSPDTDFRREWIRRFSDSNVR